MNKKISLGATVTLMLIATIITFTITVTFSQNYFNTRLADVKNKEAMYGKLAEIDQKVRSYFVGDIDEEYLRESLAHGFISGLGDRYSRYLTAEDYKDIIEGFQGNEVGIGIDSIVDKDGNIHVLSVHKGSPADNAGLKKGDKIVKVEGEIVVEIGASAAIEKLRGEVGTPVAFTVMRQDEEIDVNLTRGQFENITVESRMIGNVGYIKIRQFNNNTVQQFKDAIDDILEQGAEGVVFDVRNNPGGTLKSVAAILDMLLPEGTIISKTDKKNVTEVMHTSDKNEVNIKMVTLINERSASGAELFACALRDYEKSKLIGVTTYGKGTMQDYIALNDGSYLCLSVAKYNPPKSPNFDGKGVEPDIEVELTEEQKENFYFLSDEEDPQLQAALKEFS